ncbi:MAG: tetratricopeptide repeat protein [Leptospirales bacterium]
MNLKLSVIILVALFASSCVERNDVDQIGQEGMELFNNGDVQAALLKFEAILEMDDTIAEAHLRKADCLDLMNRYEESIASYTRAIELDPLYKEAFYNRALTYTGIRSNKKAINDYKSAIKSDPENTQELDSKFIYVNLGVLYGKEKQLYKAIESFSRAIELDLIYTDAYYNRGYAHELKGDHKKAIEDFNKALELDPGNQDFINAISHSKRQVP